MEIRPPPYRFFGLEVSSLLILRVLNQSEKKL